MNAEQIIKNQEQLKADRANWEPHWQECGDFALPENANITSQKTPGQKVGQQLFDSTAAHSNELLAGALHGILSDPSKVFFEMKTGDEMDADEDVRKFLQDSVGKMIHVINGSNFQTEVHEKYLSDTTYGTSVLMAEEDDETVIRFSTHPISEIYVDEEDRKSVV